MEYNNILKIEDIKTGDCLLVSNQKWLPRMIQKFQKLSGKDGWEYNHAGVFWWCYEELFIIEAIESGIAITPFSDYANNETYKYILIRPEFDYSGSEMGKFMLHYCGRTRYSKFNLLISQAIKFLTFGKVWIGRRHENDKRFICGEWVTFVWKKMGFNILKNYNTEKIAPIDIYNLDCVKKIEVFI